MMKELGTPSQPEISQLLKKEVLTLSPFVMGAMAR
jgi:hypothetical protein